MRILNTPLSPAIAIVLAPAVLAPAPCIAAAQVIQAPVLPAPGTPVPEDAQAVRAYTIERGMPYSGLRVTQHVLTLPDVSRHEDGSTTREWRDSEGRTRNDITWTPPTGEKVTVCQIDDPVALVRYIWKTGAAEKTVVTETHYKMDGQVNEVWPSPPTHKLEAKPGSTIVLLTPARNLEANTRDETLGPEYINGVYAEGSRSVEAIPPGRGGNSTDHSLNRIDEIWMAPDLNTVVKTFLDDGLGFTERTELKNIDRSEPDRSIFLPPSGLPKREAPESDPVWKEPIG